MLESLLQMIQKYGRMEILKIRFQITFGTLGKGYATEFKKLFNRDLNICCYVASVLQDHEIVKEYKEI